MATRPRGYGLTAELNDKIRAAYSAQDEKEILSWFSQLGLANCSGSGYDAFKEYLGDGTVLCHFANKLEPGSVNKIHDISAVKMAVFKASKSQENINFFLKWAKSYGVPDANTFQTVDLVEGTNLASVQRCLFTIGGVAKKKGFTPAMQGDL
jgi:hypothetical protein